MVAITFPLESVDRRELVVAVRRRTFENESIPENVLLSERSVVEAVLSVPVSVIGDEPMIVNEEHDTLPEHEAVVVAISSREKFTEEDVTVSLIG